MRNGRELLPSFEDRIVTCYSYVIHRAAAFYQRCTSVAAQARHVGRLTLPRVRRSRPFPGLPWPRRGLDQSISSSLSSGGAGIGLSEHKTSFRYGVLSGQNWVEERHAQDSGNKPPLEMGYQKPPAEFAVSLAR